jgi:hypothetical protein
VAASSSPCARRFAGRGSGPTWPTSDWLLLLPGWTLPAPGDRGAESDTESPFRTPPFQPD